MKTAVTVLLGFFTIWSFILFVRWIVWRWSRRQITNRPDFQQLLLREVFHLGVGIVFLILLVANITTPVITLIVTSALVLGFEYAVVLSRKLRRNRRTFEGD